MSGQSLFPPALIPLADKRIWLCWRWSLGKPKKDKNTEQTIQTTTKMPCDIGGRAIDSSKTANHRTYHEIWDAISHNVVSGAALGATSNDGTWLAIDIDKCRNPETGAIAAWARFLVESFDSYTEISPSGTGLRILGASDGWNPAERQRRWWTGPLPKNTREIEDRSGRGEIFFKSGFVTITFAAIPGYESKWSPVGEIANLLEKRQNQKTEKSKKAKIFESNPEAPVEVIRETLRSIINDGSVKSDWDFYNTIGMAIFRASNGSEDGRLAWEEWSAQHPKHGLEDNTYDRWHHWLTTSPPTELGHGSLVHIAQEMAKARGESWEPGAVWREWRTSLKELSVKTNLGPIADIEPRAETLPNIESEADKMGCEIVPGTESEPSSESVPSHAREASSPSRMIASNTENKSRSAYKPQSANVPQDTSEPNRESVPDTPALLPPLDTPVPSRPRIDTTALRLDEMVHAAAKALRDADEPVMQWAGSLVWPVQRTMGAAGGQESTITVLSPIGVNALSARVHAVSDWVQWSDLRKANIKIQPPERAMRALSESAGEKLPLHNVTGIITMPSIRASDGTYIGADGPGLDPKSRLWRAYDSNLRLPARWETRVLNRREAMVELARLDQLLDEFPWRSDVDRSIGLSALLCAAARPGMSMSPLHAISANAPGTGKSYLADIASAIVYGTPCPVMGVSSKEDETEKRLVGMLLQGQTLISIDNVNGVLGSDILNQASERPVLRLRRLGSSDMPTIQNIALIIANGNGLGFRGDQARRILLAKLETELEHPENRRFKNNPVAQVMSDRGLYAAASLWVLRAYAAANWPCANDLQPMASYEDYSRLIRGALVWLGREDPAKSTEDARKEDPDRQSLQAVMLAWRDTTAPLSGQRANSEWYTLREIEELSRGNAGFGGGGSGFASGGFAGGSSDNSRQAGAVGRLRDSLTAVASDGRGGIDMRKFARWITVRRGRKGPGGISFESRLSDSTSIVEWRLAGVPLLRLIDGKTAAVGD